MAKVQAENQEAAEEMVLDNPEEFGEPENIDHLHAFNVVEGAIISVSNWGEQS